MLKKTLAALVLASSLTACHDRTPQRFAHARVHAWRLERAHRTEDLARGVDADRQTQLTEALAEQLHRLEARLVDGGGRRRRRETKGSPYRGPASTRAR